MRAWRDSGNPLPINRTGEQQDRSGDITMPRIGIQCIRRGAHLVRTASHQSIHSSSSLLATVRAMSYEGHFTQKALEQSMQMHLHLVQFYGGEVCHESGTSPPAGSGYLCQRATCPSHILGSYIREHEGKEGHNEHTSAWPFLRSCVP